jgi:ABC-type multidrug transport system fused ATPase/permease subunit
MLYQPVNTFCQSATVIQSANAQLRRVFEIIDSVPAVSEIPNARILAAPRADIEFRNVSFHYEEGQPVLRNISLRAAQGSAVALIGRSGAGKTTLASLLTRFYDPCSGSISLDGVDLRELKLDWLRKQVSVVLQDPILFSGTIGENIAAGRAGVSKAEIIAAAERAQLHEHIVDLPNGYDTQLGERGVNLSGGQRQRLSIARALLKNSPILVLDEPTSALDVQTEQNLLRAIRELIRGRTTFIIAHRLSTVRLADQIAVLDHGRIIEHGSPTELIAAGGTYARMIEQNEIASFEHEPLIAV